MLAISLGFGAFPNEVIQMLYSNNALSVIGNFDLEVLDKNKKEKSSKKFALEYTRNVLAKVPRNLSSHFAP